MMNPRKNSHDVPVPHLGVVISMKNWEPSPIASARLERKTNALLEHFGSVRLSPT
jgi:extradiol dioxygenase family protein